MTAPQTNPQPNCPQHAIPTTQPPPSNTQYQGYYIYSTQPPNWPPLHDEPRHQKRRPKRRFLRFCRGYLMFAGGVATAYGLVKFGVIFLVELGKWLPNQPFL